VALDTATPVPSGNSIRSAMLWLWIRSAISPQHIHATNQSTTSGVVRGGQW